MPEGLLLYLMESRELDLAGYSGCHVNLHKSYLKIFGVSDLRLQLINQLGKSDGIEVSNLETSDWQPAVHRVFEFRSRMQILLIECNLISYR